VRGPGDDGVTDAESSTLHQHRRDRAAATVEVSLDRDALGRLVRVGVQIERCVGGQDDRLEQLVDVEVRACGHVDEHRVAAVLLGHQAVFGELSAHLGRVGTFDIDLVDRDDDRDLGRLGVVERLDGLRHHTVVGGDHENDDVGRVRTAGTHGGERLVTGGVDEGDLALVAVDDRGRLVGTDVLGDAAGLGGHLVRRPDGVEKTGLTVVDVTHHGHDRRTRLHVGVVALVLAELDVERLEQLLVFLFLRNDLDVVLQLAAELLKGLLRHRCRGRDHLAQEEQHLDQACRVGVDLLGEVGQRSTTREPDEAAVTRTDANATQLGCGLGVEFLPPLLARLAALGRATAGAAESAGGLASTTTGTGTACATTCTGRATEPTPGRRPTG